MQTTEKIILVRHGRSAHVQAGWIDVAGFLRWRDAYEAAGVIEGEVPPAELTAVAGSAGALVASTAPRAIESARLLAPARQPIVSPLLRELDLPPPALRLRLPMLGWALAYGARFLYWSMIGRPHVTPGERARIDEAVQWLSDLAREGVVVAVTHHGLRRQLAKTLLAQGWVAGEPKRTSAHWSAWSFTPRP